MTRRVLVLAMLSLAAASPAKAQSSDAPSAAGKAAAQESYAKGIRYFNQAERKHDPALYESAYGQFREAFAIYPDDRIPVEPWRHRNQIRTLRWGTHAPARLRQTPARDRPAEPPRSRDAVGIAGARQPRNRAPGGRGPRRNAARPRRKTDRQGAARGHARRRARHPRAHCVLSRREDAAAGAIFRRRRGQARKRVGSSARSLPSPTPKTPVSRATRCRASEADRNTECRHSIWVVRDGARRSSREHGCRRAWQHCCRRRLRGCGRKPASPWPIQLGAQIPNANNACGAGTRLAQCQQLKDANQTTKNDKNMAAAFFVTGGVAAAAALGILLLWPSASLSDSVQLVPAISPTLAGVQFRGAF